MKFAAVGDPHGEVADIDEDIDAVLLTGDLGFRPRSRKRYHVARRSGDPHLLDEAIAHGYLEAQDVLHQYDQLEKPVYVVPGNWDFDAFDVSDYSFDELLAGYENVTNVDGRVEDLEEVQLAGYGAYQFDTGPETLDEWNETLERFTGTESYTERKQGIDTTIEDVEKPLVLLTHNVPFDSGVDTITHPRSSKRWLPYGSNVIRETLEERSDIVFSVGGHIHEGRDQSYVAGAPVFNAGQNDVTYIEINDGSVIDWKPA